MSVENHISILGCGWLGEPLAIGFNEKNYLVKGSNTSSIKEKQLKKEGITHHVVNISEHAKDLSGFLHSETLIVAITSKSIGDFEHLISQIELSEIKNVVFISSTSVYPNTNGVTNEESPVIESKLVEIEQLFISNTSFGTTIIRFGGLFGGYRIPGNFLKPGKATKNPEGCINLIHRNDCIAIITKIVEHGHWNEILNACADTHPTRREFYTQQASNLGKPSPIFNESSTNEYKIVSNEKLKSLLNYEFELSDLMAY